MYLHERTLKVQKAQADINFMLIKAIQEHNLTNGEVIMLIGSFLQSTAKYMIREERHPEDPGKCGDVA